MTWRVPPFDRAVVEAEAHIRATYRPLGIVVAGSIVRGEAGPTSDLDICVVHAEPWRQRAQHRFAGVPTEIFVGPPGQVRRYFASEHADGHPSTANMYATGEVLPGADPIIDELVREARDWLARPLVQTDEQLTNRRYEVVDSIDDARDVVHDDPAAARLLLAHAVERTIAYAFWSRRQFQPRRKARVAALAAIDPEAAALVRRWAAADGDAALDAVTALARHVLGVDTFFEWASAPEQVEP